jgi:hypothetical protein
VILPEILSWLFFHVGFPIRALGLVRYPSREPIAAPTGVPANRYRDLARPARIQAKGKKAQSRLVGEPGKDGGFDVIGYVVAPHNR